ncbi:MAG TPA: glycosyl hydrolase family 39 [Acidobacteriaceae bacterium]|jgi:xylan 1,4-beta-xylosidase|nr:glycosyl hydrolase family 39 [Acidobacteriaceae bacterium]
MLRPGSAVFAAAATALLLLPCAAQNAAGSQGHDEVRIAVDAHAAGTAFPHFWEQMFGSGHANLAMRASYQSDVQRVKKIADFRYVRFHDIFHDDNGVYQESAQGQPEYNWSYVDQIYDSLLANNVRPYVELGFMPKALAARSDYQGFWYKPIASPPSSYAKWDALITAFAQHLIERYGVNEVADWYFEVWNEPNLDFWMGSPKQETYFELYDHTARALKAVNARIRVGGPATAQAAWVGDMIAHAEQAHVPLDFVSTHVYGDDSTKDVFHDNRALSPHQMVSVAVDKVHAKILHSARPDIPLIWSEYNASFANYQNITDSIYMGPWLADTISRCDGKTQMMSYWTFSDVFDEQGVVKTPFYGGFGIVAEDGIPKPAYNAFMLLDKLGDVRLPAPTDEALVTRRADGTLVIAAWNWVEPEVQGSDKTVTFDFSGVADGIYAEVRRVDAQHGDTLDA